MVSTNTRKEEEMTTHITDRDDAVQLRELPALSGIDRLALRVVPFVVQEELRPRRQNS